MSRRKHLLFEQAKKVIHLIEEGLSGSKTFTQIACVINRLEEQKLKQIFSDKDTHAFIPIYDVSDVKKREFIKQNVQKHQQK